MVVCLAVVTVGCSSSSDGGGGSGSRANLDCAWLSSNNCWKTTATSASSCLPPASETGVLSADNKTCTYASGAVVTFAQPLVLPVPDDAIWNFTIANAGQTCLHYEDTGTSFVLTVGGQTVTEGLSGALGLQIQCPTGDTYSNSNAFDLLSCGGDSGAFGGLPGNAYSEATSSINFGLVGTSATSSSDLQLFNCAK